MLLTVLDNSLTNIYAAKAVRDPATGQLVDFTISFCNSAFLERVRLTEDAVRTGTLRSLFPVLEQTGFLTRYMTVVETGEPFVGEQEYPGPNGDFWYQTSVRKLGDGVVVNFIDVTDRKRAELAVQRQADELRAVLDASISSIFYMRAIRNEASGRIVDFRINLANRTTERSTNLTPEQVIGRTLLEMFPGNVENGFFEAYVRVVETGQPERMTRPYRDERGLEGWFEISAVKQSPDGVVVTFLNVTESNQNAVRVQQQADLLQSVLNATLTAVSTYEPVRDEAGRIMDFRFLLSNQAARTMLGTDELRGKTLCEMNPPLRGSEALKQYVAVAQTGQPVAMERFARGRWFLISVVPFGEQGLLTSSIDITDLKQAQFQIEQLNAQLQRSNASLDRFASVASHDLQEPLRKIKTFGDLLLDRHANALPDEARDLLKRMQLAADRMQTLIRDLLAFSRLAKDGGTAWQPVRLNRIVDEVLVDLELAVTDKGAAVDVGDLPTVTGDALQLRQVFQNLLSNALKFTEPGRPPKITVTYRRVRAADVPVDLIKSDGASGPYDAIAVADNGIGFANAYAETIFGAFERLHGKSSPYGGTGIGLAIVRRVMENHHGAVNAHGVEGEGATFTLYFPVMN